MEDWLPELARMTASSEERIAELLSTNRLIRNRLLRIAEDSTHDPSRVGALKGSLQSVQIDLELLQSTGKMEKVSNRLEVSSNPQILIGLYDHDSPSWKTVKAEIAEKKILGVKKPDPEFIEVDIS